MNNYNSNKNDHKNNDTTIYKKVLINEIVIKKQLSNIIYGINKQWQSQ